MFKGFGQSTNSVPGTTESAFGPVSNASNTSSACIGGQTGKLIFWGTSTGISGAPQSPSFSTTNAFGSSSTPCLGPSTKPALCRTKKRTTLAFGATSTVPAFGAKNTTSAFGSAASPAFGSTISNITVCSSPSGAFGTTPTLVFGASTTAPPTFATSSAPASGAKNTTSAFGSTASPAFGCTGTTSNSTVCSSPLFGTCGAFGATPTVFGASTTAPPSFATSTAPASGVENTAPSFGPTASPPFGGTTSNIAVCSSPLFGIGGAFGTSSTPISGATTTAPTFATSTAPAMVSSSSVFGQSTSAFGSNRFGSNTSTFGAQSSPFGTQLTTPGFGSSGFGQSAFGGQRNGSRQAPYAETTETEGGGQAGKLQSLSAMPIYKDKSHDELRWEDYQSGDKGGPLPLGQSPGRTAFGMTTPQSNPFAPSTGFGQTSANIFCTTTKPFAPKTQTSTAFTSPFGPSTSSNLFQSLTPGFSIGSSPSLFGTSTSNFTITRPSLFSSTTGQVNTSTFTNMFSNTQSSPSFPSTTPSIGQMGGFAPAALFGQSSTPSLFSSPSADGLFSSTPNLTGFNQMAQSQPVPSQWSQPAQNLAGTIGFTGLPSTLEPSYTTQGAVALQPVPVANPFGTLPATPQLSTGQAGTTISVQLGISDMPVIGKPSPVRISSFRRRSQRRIALAPRKYYPKHDGLEVTFFRAPSTRFNFAAQISPFGTQPATPGFRSSGFDQSAFGGQHNGSRQAPYAVTTEMEGGGQVGKLLSISAMPVYKDKSHEELRWEDHQSGDKGSSVFGQNPSGGFGSTAQSTNFGSTNQQSQPAFGSSLLTSTIPFGTSTQSAFGIMNPPALAATSITPVFGSTTSPAFGSTGPAFSVSGSPLFVTGGASGTSVPSVFGASITTPAFGTLSASVFLVTLDIRSLSLS